MPLLLPAGHGGDHVSCGHALWMAEQQGGRSLGPEEHSQHRSSDFDLREPWTSTVMFGMLGELPSVMAKSASQIICLPAHEENHLPLGAGLLRSSPAVGGQMKAIALPLSERALSSLWRGTPRS